jgi:hypothetical protein
MPTRDDLDDLLREQVDFLRRSARAYDDGYTGEAKRLALTIRVLVHQTSSSHALLEQMGHRTSIGWWDTKRPIAPGVVAISDPGLVVLKMTTGTEGGVTYEAPFDVPWGHWARFEPWWTDKVFEDQMGTQWSRKQFVTRIANTEGGGHVQPRLDRAYAALTRENSFGWTWGQEGRAARPIDGNLPLASVRQIAYEVERTLSTQLS